MRGRRIKSIEELLLKRYQQLSKRASEIRSSNRKRSDELIQEASMILVKLQKMKQGRHSF